jgi:selenocysteine lyase/cysteine desulfurase
VPATRPVRSRLPGTFSGPGRAWKVAASGGGYDPGMDPDALRAVTPGCASRLHLNNAGAALLTRPTLDAMTGHLRLEAELGGYEAAAAAQGAIDATYAGLAELVGGQPGEVALFDNATRAWQAAFYSIPLGPGDRILTGRAEYGSNVLAYFQVARRTGAEVVVVPNDEHGQLDTTALAGLIDERTKLIGVTHVPTSGGLVNPAVEIGRIAREAGVLYLLNATQSVGQFPVDARAIGCDLLTGTGRKFPRGPRGTGFLWVRTESLERLEPYVAEIRSATWDGRRGFTWVQGARRFETWENSYVNIIGLGAAVRQALDLGLTAIGERTMALGARLRQQLDVLPGVSTHDLGRVRCAIVTARVDGMAAADVAAALAGAGINVTTTVPEDTQFDTEDRGVHPLVRLSPHYYNTNPELDRAVDAVAGLPR